MQFGNIMKNRPGEAFLFLNGRQFLANLTRGFDISRPVRVQRGARAFGIPAAEVKAFRAGTFVGDVRQGGSCNCESVTFTPHGNGTHTESWGHLTKKRVGVLAELTDILLHTHLISLQPHARAKGDLVIEAEQIKTALNGLPNPEALVVRTLFPTPRKLSDIPAYFAADALHFLAKQGVRHLVTDLPSLDRFDDKKLMAHRAWWDLPVGAEKPHPRRRHCTVTELARIASRVKDGTFIMNLQVVGFPTDASPSRPILFPALMFGKM